jgi:hypothetical protein
MGIEYAVLAHDVAGPDAEPALRGAELMWAGNELSLYRLGAAMAPPPPSYLGLIVVVDLLVVLLVFISALVALLTRKRRFGC